MSSLASVRAFAAAFHARFARLDVLVNNAAASLRTREVTPEGFERHWATNVLGPHLLIQLLLPALEASGHGRVVTVSTRAAGGARSDRQPEPAPPIQRHRRVPSVKAGQPDADLGPTDRLRGTPVTANALNPGYVLFELTTNVEGPLKVLVVLTRWRAQSALDGADTAIWLAASPEVDGVTGRFWNNRREIRCRFRDPAATEQLWHLVEFQTAATAPA